MSLCLHVVSPPFMSTSRLAYVAPSVLFLYESLSTLSQEVDVIWRRKRTMSTWLYAATRYVTVAEQVVNLLPATSITVSLFQPKLCLSVKLCWSYRRGMILYPLTCRYRAPDILVLQQLQGQRIHQPNPLFNTIFMHCA